MHKSATKCNETLSKWCKNKHGASKIIDTFETYQYPHVRAWRYRVEYVIKHTDYTEYVSEDPVVLLCHRLKRGRRRAALREREREIEDVDDGEATVTRVAGSG
jgi:hypothetical protein